MIGKGQGISLKLGTLLFSILPQTKFTGPLRNLFFRRGLCAGSSFTCSLRVCPVCKFDSDLADFFSMDPVNAALLYFPNQVTGKTGMVKS